MTEEKEEKYNYLNVRPSLLVSYLPSLYPLKGEGHYNLQVLGSNTDFDYPSEMKFNYIV